MKLPSIQNLIQNSIHTLKRFPLVICSGILIATIAITIMESNSTFVINHEKELVQVILSLIFSIPLFAAIQLTLENSKINKNWKYLGVAIPVVYYFYIPNPNSTEFLLDRTFLKQFILIAGSFGTLTFLPYFKRQEANGYWQYLRSMTFNLAITTLFAIVLFIGTSLIFLATEELLGINISEDLYFEAWVVITSVFSVWHYASTIPKNISKLDKDKAEYSLIKKFGQFILLPLVTVFAGVLYAYVAKIIFTQTWPEGIVSSMVVSFSTIAIGSHIILSRYKDEWIKRYIKWLYLALTPLTVVLFMAVQIRISEYGWTENRYYLVLFGVFLSGNILYFLFNKTKTTKTLTSSLTILAVLSVIGPWSSFNVSENDQIARLKAHIAADDKTSASQVLQYLSYQHGFEEIKNSIPDLPEDFNQLSQYEQRQAIELSLGISENDYYQGSYRYLTFSEELIENNDYQYFIELNIYSGGAQTVEPAGESLIFSLDESSLEINTEKLEFSSEISNLQAQHNKTGYTTTTPPVQINSQTIEGTFYVRQLSYNMKDNKIDNLSGYLFFNLK